MNLHCLIHNAGEQAHQGTGQAAGQPIVEIYSNGCNRLIWLRAEADQDYLTAYLREQIECAIREVNEEMGLGDVRGDRA